MKRFLILILCLVITKTSFGWGQKGHDIVAYVAESNLTPEAVGKIDEVLAGRSLVYYSNWMDGIRGTEKFEHTSTWHYINVDEGMTLESMPRNPDGDVLSAVDSIVEKLKNGTLTPEDEAINLKMLIHLVADMHCPMHAGHKDDRGGNSKAVVFFSDATNLHSIWDTALIDAAHKWSYTEWKNQIDIYDEIKVKELQAGTPTDWTKETLEVCNYVYQNTPPFTALSYDYVEMARPILEEQLLKGGVRLAKLLNEIYE